MDSERMLSEGPEDPRRSAVVERETAETKVSLNLIIEGSGCHRIDTGVGFLDHMLAHVAVHGLFALEARAEGDLHVDPHHTVEDVALAIDAGGAGPDPRLAAGVRGNAGGASSHVGGSRNAVDRFDRRGPRRYGQRAKLGGDGGPGPGDGRARHCLGQC